VSMFRPARKLIAPDGNEWEVYVSRRLVRRSQAGTVRIKAVTYFPRRESLLWTASVDHADRVLHQIAVGLEAGDIARPLGGVYVGRNV
jgi:hypothetical protein